jgi:hypothetical protein
VLEETHDRDQIIQRVAALDVGKAERTCCVRVPGPGSSGRRRQEVRTYQTMTRWLLVMTDRLAELGVTRVVMEATSDYWKGVHYLLEAHGFEVWLVNARDPRAPPRAAQDRHPGCGLAVQARRAADAAPLICPATTNPAAAGRDPLPGRPGGGPDRRDPAGRAAAGGRPDQALGGGQRHLRGVGAGHAGRAAGRRARPQGPQPSWPAPGCAPSCRCWRRRSVGSSPTSTPSCSPRCWPGWTPWTPTWPSSNSSSRPTKVRLATRPPISPELSGVPGPSETAAVKSQRPKMGNRRAPAYGRWRIRGIRPSAILSWPTTQRPGR